MQLTYDMINNMTMTVAQHNDIVKGIGHDVAILCIFLFVLIVLGFIGLAVYYSQYNKLRTFIRENKLQSKFQDWRKNDEGLDV